MEQNKDYLYLKNSLIFQMSLGSKELFHSNIWAWLIEQDYTFVKVFFNDFDFNRFEIDHVDREKYHRDLIIWVHDKFSTKKGLDYFVIENKVKSLPSEDQLEKYSIELNNKKLLGAVITGFDDHLKNRDFNGIKWTFVSYAKIADSIEDILLNSKIIDSTKRAQIHEYCDGIRALHRLIHTKLDEIGEHLLCDQWDEKKYEWFNRLRIADLLKKANGAKFVRYLIENNIYELETPDIMAKGYRLLLRQGFHNNKVTIDIFFTNADEKESNDFFIIGTQTEGNQFRHIACKKTYYGKENLFNEMAQKRWFDKDYESKGTNRKVFGYDSRMKKAEKYNSYNPNSFVYQHFEIKGSDSSYNDDSTKRLDNSFYNLYQKIEEDMSIAKQIILSFE